jgi:hypothetical protein
MEAVCPSGMLVAIYPIHGTTSQSTTILVHNNLQILSGRGMNVALLFNLGG